MKNYIKSNQTSLSDSVSQPTFTENTFYIPLRRAIQTDDLLTFEAYVVDENMHTLLGRGVINPAQFIYTVKGSTKYLLLTTFQRRKEIIVGQFQLSIQYTDKSDSEEITFNDSQKEKNYLNQLLVRSFLEGVENPLYEKQLLNKIVKEKDIDLLDPTNHREKWRLYSQTLQERISSIKEYKRAMEKYERILRAQQIIKTDYVKGNRLLKQLLSFNNKFTIWLHLFILSKQENPFQNRNRCWGEDHIDFHVHIDQKMRTLSEKEVFSQMSATLRKILYWQVLNIDLEEFLLNSKAYIENLGQLLLMKENSKEGYKDSIRVKRIIDEEVQKEDYYKQKVERQDNFIDKLSRTMEYVVKTYSHNENLENEFINLRGDVLTIQENIRKKLYGENPKQLEELEYLADLCKKLSRIVQQQAAQIKNIHQSLIKNNAPSRYLTLQTELKAVQLKVNALEEQIKINGQKFSEEISQLQVEISVKKNAISTTSISNITYKLPKDVYEEF